MDDINPWRPLEYTCERKEYPAQGSMPARSRLVTKWVNEIRPPACLKLQLRNRKTGKMALILSSPYVTCEHVGDIMVNWPKRNYDDPDVLIPYQHIDVRIDDKKYRTYLFVREHLRVGDFVKCRGTRQGDWNKVEELMLDKDRLFGPKYSKPEEGFMRYHASDNHLSKVSSIVRNGITII
jgi:hypothetical protein